MPAVHESKVTYQLVPGVRRYARKQRRKALRKKSNKATTSKVRSMPIVTTPKTNWRMIVKWLILALMALLYFVEQ